MFLRRALVSQEANFLHDVLSYTCTVAWQETPQLQVQGRTLCAGNYLPETPARPLSHLTATAVLHVWAADQSESTKNDLLTTSHA